MANEVWIDVLPSLGGFAQQLSADTAKAGAKAGKSSGDAWSKAFEDSAGDGGSAAATDELIKNEKRARKAVDDATAAIGNARATQREAAARTVLAEQAVTDAVEKYGEESAKAQAAALRLESARDRQTVATNKTERAEETLRAAAREAAESTRQLEEATKDSAAEGEESVGVWGRVGAALGKTKDSLAEAGSGFGGLALQVGGAIGGAALFSAAWDDAFDLSAGTSRLAAALDLTEEQSQRAGDVAGSLYASAYGESLEDVNVAVETVISSLAGMRDASESDLQSITGQAMSMASAFDIDVQEAVTAAGALITSGLAPDATAAFDLITASLQQVPIAMRGDVLDAVNEYGAFFQTLGIDGSEAMGLLVAASDGGTIAIDKIGDALKEFTIRSTDMSEASTEAYKSMGLNAKDMTNSILAGGDDANKAFGKIVKGLQEIKDPGEQAATAIALFGTPLEDLNVSEIPAFLGSLSAMDSSLGDVSGKAAALDSAMDATIDPIEEMKRSFMGMLSEGLEPIVEPLQNFSEWATSTPGVMEAVGIALGIVTVAWAAMTLAASPWLAIGAGIALLIGGIILAFNNWGAIVDWLRGVWEPIADWFSNLWQPIADWFNNLWQGVKDGIAVAWDGIQSGLKTGWDWIGKNVFDPIKAGAGWVADKFTATKDGIILAWDLMKASLKAGWTWIGTNVFDPIKSGAGWVADKFTTIKDNVIASWTALKDNLKAGWTWIGTNVFDPMKKGVDAIGDTFDKTKDFIGTAWGKIKEVAAKPVNFIIETVYTKGIKNAWDTIASKVGLDLKLPTISPIKFADGGVLPGYTPGRDVHDFVSPTGGRLSLSGGEAIMRPEFTRAMGGEAGIARLNAQARMGTLQAFAGGGVWDKVKSGAKGAWDWTAGAAGKTWDWTKNTASSIANFVSDPIAALADLIGKPVQNYLGQMAPGIVGDTLKQVPGKFLDGLGSWAKKSLFGRETEGGGTSPGGSGMGYRSMVDLLKGRFPDLRITSTYRPGAITAVGTPSMHGKGRAVDMAPRMDVFNWLRAAYPGSTELIYSPAGGRQLYNGRPHLYSGVTKQMHYNHVHWGMKNGGVIPSDLNFGTYDTGGVLPPGDTLVSNKTGKPELILNPEQIAGLSSPRGPLDLSDETISKLSGQIASDLGLVGKTVRDVEDTVSKHRTLERLK